MKPIPQDVTASITSSSSAAELLGHIAARLQEGERVDLARLIAAHPQHEAALRQLVPTMQALAMFGHESTNAGPEFPPLDAEPSCVAELSGVPPVLDDFRVVREIARGGMGIVFEAQQISVGRRVALKVLPFAAVLDPRQLQRFRNEVHAAGQLHHSHIVPVYAMGCDRGVHYYAMQYISGQTLAQIIRQMATEEPHDSRTPEVSPANVPTVPLPESTGRLRTTERSGRSSEAFRAVARLGVQAAEALEHAHRAGIIHRDIKPSNLLVDADGKLWITDFGLARSQTDCGLTMTGDVLGTLRYMSPEQAFGSPDNLDGRTDVYSLGATLYELLTLRPVIAGATRQEIIQVLHEQDPIPPRKWDRWFPADLENILLKALSKERALRYASAQDLADDLRRFLDHQPVLARRPTLRWRLFKWTVRHRIVVVTAAAVALLASLAAMIPMWLVQRESTRQEELASQRGAQLRHRAYVDDLTSAWLHWQRAQPMEARARFAGAIPPSGQAQPDFAFRLLRHWMNNCRDTLSGHRGLVYHVDYSPDGQKLATCGVDGTVRIWNADNGELEQTHQVHDDEVNMVLFLQNGKQFVTSSDDKTVCVWDTRSGTKLEEWGPFADEVGHLAVSPDEQRIAFYVHEHGSLLWSIAERREIRELGRVYVQAFSPDGHWLAAVDERGSELIWDAVTWEKYGDLPANNGAFQVAAFSPDGKLFATSDTNRGVSLWKLDSSRPVLMRRWQLTSLMLTLEFAPDSTRVAAAGKDQVVHVFDTDSDAHWARYLGHARQIWSVSFSPDGTQLASVSDDGTGRVWDVRHRQDSRRLPRLPHPVNSVALTSDGRTLFTLDGDLQSWSVETLQPLATYPALPARILRGLAISPDDRWIAVGDVNGWLYLLPADGSAPPRKWKGRTNEPWCLAFSPDGQRLAVQAVSEVHTWELASLHRQHHFSGPFFPEDGIDRLAYSQDGSLIASVTVQTARVWNSQTGRQVAEHFFPDMLGAIEWIPGTRSLVVAGNDLWIWNMETSKVLTLHGSDHTILTVAASLDGRILASGDLGGGLLLWDVATGERICALPGHVAAVHTACFSRDGKLLVTGGPDVNGTGQVILWSAP